MASGYLMSKLHFDHKGGWMGRCCVFKPLLNRLLHLVILMFESVIAGPETALGLTRPASISYKKLRLNGCNKLIIFQTLWQTSFAVR